MCRRHSIKYILLQIENCAECGIGSGAQTGQTPISSLGKLLHNIDLLSWVFSSVLGFLGIFRTILGESQTESERAGAGPKSPI